VTLSAKIVAVHLALRRAKVPHAFGGALALAWCTQRARGTIDIDLNVFLPVDGAPRVRDALADLAVIDDASLAAIARDGQVRVWFDDTPLDLFFNTTPFHERAAMRARVAPFAGHQVPFLSCDDIAVFKAFFNRTKDWADLEEMIEAGTIDPDRVIGALRRYLPDGDSVIGRLIWLTGGSRSADP
jgi:hypothetical protein